MAGTQEDQTERRHSKSASLRRDKMKRTVNGTVNVASAIKWRVVIQKIMPGFFILLLLITSGSCSGGNGDLFLQGRKAVTQGRFQEAIPLLRQYIQEKPQGKHAGRAFFFLAKAHIGQGEYDKAQAVFASLLRDMPDTLEARKAEYKLALLELWRGRPDNARKRLQAVLAHADSPLVPEAGAMLRYLEKIRNDSLPQSEAI